MLSIRVEGLSQLIKDIIRTKRQLPKKAEAFVTSLGDEILDLAKKEIGINTRISKMMEMRNTKRSQGQVTTTLGWTANYGSILEFGARKKMWTIVPRNKKVLKFTSGGKTYFVKKVVRHWDASSLRKHFSPAIEKAMKNIREKAKKVIIGD